MYLLPLIVIFVLLYAVLGNRETRDCRWRERRGSAESIWTCVQCGCQTAGQAGAAPKQCLRR